MDEPNSTGSPPTATPAEPDFEPSASASSKESMSEAAKNAPAPANSFWREMAFLTVQHANRSLVILLIALMVGIGIFLSRHELACLLASAESIKAGSFEFRVREAATYQQVNAEFGRLAELNDQQLQLFMILGKKRGSNAAGDYGIAYTGEEVTKPNLEKLQEIGLLSGVQEPAPNKYRWDVTAQGMKLHGLLVGQVVNSIKIAAQGPCKVC